LSQREAKLNLRFADTRAVYQEGEEAVVLLVKSLLARIERIEARLDQLENQQKKDSRNSSKPPSGDGFKKRTKSLRQKSKRPSGGQKGHPGSTLEWCEAVDEVVKHPVDTCESCGASLAGAPGSCKTLPPKA
jgi:transposase